MSEPFPWKEEYLTGIPNIDEQHQNLFRIVNRFFTTPDSETERVQGLAMELYRHTRNHFRDEEAFLKEIGFPHLERHREQHDAILSRLNDYAARLPHEPGELAAFQEFLETWIREHILEHDREIELHRHRQPG